MSNAPILSVETVMAAGIKRISGLVDKFGITSPEVYSACERWGGILDDINYPDDTCRWCGKAVTHLWEGQGPSKGVYYHIESQSKYCWGSAPAVATPHAITKSGIVLK